ncbi:MAG: PA2779 family protein, partial [Deltaproteobacteria bacterium]|nr:PA2779 family protein [Deltaproteobacteria bacterium]
MGAKLSLNSFKNPLLVLSVTIWFTAFLLFPALATAALSDSILSSPGASLGREAELAKVRQVLESKIAGQKLKDFGLSPDEVSGKLSSMTDEQVHHMASLSDRISVFGYCLGVLLVLLLMIFIVFFILIV